MKLYSSPQGSNPRRVRMFLIEKGIEIPTEEIDLIKGESRTPEFLKINSLGHAPVLVLNDGTVITESVAICRYLEELHPEPTLFGSDPVSRALIDMWIRRVESQYTRLCTDAVQHSAPFFKTRVVQCSEYAAIQLGEIPNGMAWLDSEIGGRDYIAGDDFSMADIVCMTAHGMALSLKVEPGSDLKNYNAWLARVSERESFEV